jgi:hypothetical protein
MLTARRALPLALALSLAGITALGAVVGAAPAARAAAAHPVYSVPSGAWSQFESDLSGAEGLATGLGVTVAILASGVDPSAAGLAGKATEGPDYIYAPRESLANASGTLTAGMIEGVPGTTQGAAPGVRILGIRVAPDGNEPGAQQFYDQNAANFEATEQPVLAQAITYAVTHGARVIEVSAEVWGDGGVDTALATAVATAIRHDDVIIAPESYEGTGTGSYLYPAGLPGVIGVTSAMLPGGVTSIPGDGAALPAVESAGNNSVVIAGPGDWVAGSSGDWGMIGPPSAAAYVAATAALIEQSHPGIAPALVEQALAMSARDKPAGGYDAEVGFGVLDPYEAVLDADKLVKDTVTAAPGAGMATAGTHFGAGPLPGVVVALPPAGSVVDAYWAAIGAGVLLLIIAVVLAAVFAIRARRAAGVPGAIAADGGGTGP